MCLRRGKPMCSLLSRNTTLYVFFKLSRNLRGLTIVFYGSHQPLLFTFILFKSFYHVLWSPQRTKGPGTRKAQSDGSLFRSCKQHPSVKPSLPLEPFC